MLQVSFSLPSLHSSINLLKLFKYSFISFFIFFHLYLLLASFSALLNYEVERSLWQQIVALKGSYTVVEVAVLENYKVAGLVVKGNCKVVEVAVKENYKVVERGSCKAAVEED